MNFGHLVNSLNSNFNDKIMKNNRILFAVLVALDPLEVHIQVNVALRRKLVEEIKDNTVKVKVLSKGFKVPFLTL